MNYDAFHIPVTFVMWVFLVQGTSTQHTHTFYTPSIQQKRKKKSNENDFYYFYVSMLFRIFWAISECCEHLEHSFFSFFSVMVSMVFPSTVKQKNANFS